jgi:hypothetical protein
MDDCRLLLFELFTGLATRSYGKMTVVVCHMIVQPDAGILSLKLVAWKPASWVLIGVLVDQ